MERKNPGIDAAAEHFFTNGIDNGKAAELRSTGVSRDGDDKQR